MKNKKNQKGSSSLFRLTPTGKKVFIDWQDYNLPTVEYGGQIKKDLLEFLKDNGINCRGDGYSPLVGHYAIRIDARQLRKADKIIFH